MTYLHLYAGPDGHSHVERIELDLGSPDAAGRVFAAEDVLFSRIPAGSFFDWHPAPARQITVTLAGVADITASDGSSHALEPGTAVLVDDLSGTGHQTRIRDSADRILVSVRLKDGGSANGDWRRTPRTTSSQEPEPIMIPRLHTTESGGTAFDEVDVAGLTNTEWFQRPVDSVVFARLPAGFFADWHTEARRQIVITLGGEAEIVTTDGQRRRVGPGAALLVEDLVGTGHQTIVPDTSDRLLMLIALSDSDVA
jgi:quercetin dioxygenase-like cupin family protein